MRSKRCAILNGNAGLATKRRTLGGVQNDPNRFTDADKFHRTFANAIGYGDIWSILENQKTQFDRIRFLSLPDVTPVDLLIGQHRVNRIIVSRVSSPRWPTTGGCDCDGASGSRERAAGSRHSMGDFVERGTKIAKGRSRQRLLKSGGR
jgi:hypothetical protein